MLGIQFLDVVVIVAYFAVVTLIGWWSARKIKTTGDFFLGGRKFGSFLTAMLSFGTGTHADQAVGVVSKSYQIGLSGIWYEWMWLLVNPFFWIMAPILRRLRVVNCADYFALRYNKSLAALYAVLAVVILMLNIGTMVLGASRMIEGLTGGGISFYLSVTIITVLFVFYGLAGGMVAAALNDVVQGVLTIVFSFMMIPYALAKIGGIHVLHEKVNAVTSYDFFSLVTPEGITVFWVLMIVVNGMINWAVQPHIIPSSTANRTEMDARIGVTYGNFIKRFCTVAWAFIGVAAITLVPNLQNPDNAFGEAARLLLPVGMVGLLIASLLATIQSTGVVLMISGSSIFIRSFYAELVKHRSEAHYLLAGRWVSFLIVGGGLVFAMLLPGVIKALELFMQIPALIGIPFWFGIMWRRANPASAWASFLASAATFLFCELALDLYLPVQMVCYLSVGIVTGIVVGLLTPRQPKEHLDTFYNRLKTPVLSEEILATDTVV